MYEEEGSKRKEKNPMRILRKWIYFLFDLSPFKLGYLSPKNGYWADSSGIRN
jgi:hypothetical protein